MFSSNQKCLTFLHQVLEQQALRYGEELVARDSLESRFPYFSVVRPFGGNAPLNRLMEKILTIVSVVPREIP